MPNKIAKFEVISKENYDSIVKRNGLDTIVKYENIKKPARATEGSAGYDFFITKDISLRPGEECVIHTLIRCKIKRGWALFILPKSGLGFTYKVMLANTIGLIDEDYYNTVNDEDSNEGHIMIKLVNTGNKIMTLEAGKKFCQGVFLMYGITEDDDLDEKEIRNGGFGSTGN